MEALARKFRTKSGRIRWLLVALVVLVAIIIPLAVILPKRKASEGLRSTILVPLYIYPSLGAWNALYDAAAARPRQNFTVILNPSSGPGSSPYPSSEYISQIQKLNSYPNVRTIGYVHTAYATRNISLVLADVSTYSNWYNVSVPGVNTAGPAAVHGIFFDEAPTQYSPETDDYLRTINKAVKSAPGLLPDRLVIHNPGSIPDSRFEDSNTDSTVVFEDTYQSFQNRSSTLAALSEDRSRYSYVIHSVPTTLSKTDLKSFLAKLSHHAGFLFLTDLDHDYYESFGSRWSSFINAMPT